MSQSYLFDPLIHQATIIRPAMRNTAISIGISIACLSLGIALGEIMVPPTNSAPLRREQSETGGSDSVRHGYLGQQKTLFNLEE
jgi:hypothetical protein